MRKRKEPLVLNYKCSKCGADVNLEKYNPAHPAVSRMKKDGICYHCAYWSRFFERQKRYEIVKGNVYLYGTKYFISRKDIVRTRYILHTGNTVQKMLKSFRVDKVPADFCIPDTGTFISLKAYLSLSKRVTFYCRATGCYDRYHCMLYNPEIMEPKGPWNIIPKSHKIGGEYCPSFLNKETEIVKEQ